MYLLDTNVVSELRKRKPHKGVVAWVQAAPEDSLYVSAVTVGEIQAGKEITRKQCAVKAKEIELWLDGFAISWALGSAYLFYLGAWLLGAIQGVFAILALDRWRQFLQRR